MKVGVMQILLRSGRDCSGQGVSRLMTSAVARRARVRARRIACMFKLVWKLVDEYSYFRKVDENG
jgi:hypothetical protein